MGDSNMGTGRRIVIINRWEDDFGDYERLVDHGENTVSYIVNRAGYKYLEMRPNLRSEYRIIEEFSETAVEEAIKEMFEREDRPDRIIALSESNMLVAAAMRDRFRVDGLRLKDTLKFVDKVEMKGALNGSGVRVPRYLDNLVGDDYRSFVDAIGFPVVLKPRREAGSRGVEILSNLEELERSMGGVNLLDFELEEYVAGEIVHIDGVVEGSRIVFQKAFKYINTCFDYTRGKFVGSVLVDDVELERHLFDFAEKVVSGIGMAIGVFHLEAIIDENQSPTFLEIAIRQGGGEIVPLIKRIYGVDIVEALFRTQLGESVSLDIQRNEEGLVGAFLLFPEPQAPCRVTGVIDLSMDLKTLEYQVLPKVDSVLTGKGGYYFNAGRFLFVGKKEDVELDLDRVQREYSIKTEQLSVV